MRGSWLMKRRRARLFKNAVLRPIRRVAISVRKLRGAGGAVVHVVLHEIPPGFLPFLYPEVHDVLLVDEQFPWVRTIVLINPVVMFTVVTIIANILLTSRLMLLVRLAIIVALD